MCQGSCRGERAQPGGWACLGSRKLAVLDKGLCQLRPRVPDPAAPIQAAQGWVFYPFIFYRLRAEYENHQPKHLKKGRVAFLSPKKCLCVCIGWVFTEDKENPTLSDYVQAGPGPALLPTGLIDRSIAIAALCTGCIDLYIGMYSPQAWGALTPTAHALGPALLVRCPWLATQTRPSVWRSP